MMFACQRLRVHILFLCGLLLAKLAGAARAGEELDISVQEGSNARSRGEFVKFIRDLHNATAEVKMRSTEHSQRVVYCDGYCVSCAPDKRYGIVKEYWYISRGQSTGTKAAKVSIFLGGMALVGITGGVVAAASMGVVAVFNTFAALSIAGGAIGLAKLMTAHDDRACPVVTFKEIPAGEEVVKKVLSAKLFDFWKKIREDERDERNFGIADILQDELLMRWNFSEYAGDGQEVPDVHWDRAKIHEKWRLPMVMACNSLTLDNRMWNVGKKDQVTNKKKQLSLEQEQEKRMQHLVYMCGEWLCNDQEGDIKFEKVGLNAGKVSCGGKTSWKKALGLS